ncbi:MAG: hypothetical protein HKN99_09560 [Winogradskyella sp.]|nr:hypothetical protein [Winogradskyella sp.]MBT8377088.1 hypothetical protein [Bacteroidia bacterium]NNC46116.1 hypothetical protein [Winogradskyella sp.]NNF85063.1 hypothetical protein [Winogradskyella sp.]
MGLFQDIEAQLTDIARLEYSFIPKSRSDDEYTRIRTLLNYPIKIGGDSYLVIGGEYNRIALELEDTYPFETDNINRIQVIDLNLGYTFKTSKHNRFAIQFNPRLASTLTQSPTMDDVFLNGAVYYINDRTDDDDLKRPYRLVLGLTYNTTTGIPFPLPFVSYYRRINKKWSMNLGIPKNNLNYHIDDQNIIEIFGSVDGYFANVQEGFMVNNQQVRSISLSVAVLGLGYAYHFSEHLSAYMYSGCTVLLNNALRQEDRTEIFKLDQLNAFYLRTGLKFKI